MENKKHNSGGTNGTGPAGRNTWAIPPGQEPQVFAEGKGDMEWGVEQSTVDTSKDHMTIYRNYLLRVFFPHFIKDVCVGGYRVLWRRASITHRLFILSWEKG